ncbi:hypothetical protein [Rhodococcus sp. KBS0724]|uniref:hypothetical protein n=1 Tax=Rhodococcus sp. KBS0724 TaxID=1179674 RepID=UPI00163D7202|nr:hypothetical protein [Rhodococcus sp. KBS0724]
MITLGRPFSVLFNPGGPNEREFDALTDAEPIKAGGVIRIPSLAVAAGERNLRGGRAAGPQRHGGGEEDLTYRHCRPDQSLVK